MFDRNIWIAVIILAGIAAIFGITLVLDLDVLKWVNCNSPFTNSQEKASQVCNDLKIAP